MESNNELEAKQRLDSRHYRSRFLERLLRLLLEGFLLDVSARVTWCGFGHLRTRTRNAARTTTAQAGVGQARPRNSGNGGHRPKGARNKLAERGTRPNAQCPRDRLARASRRFWPYADDRKAATGQRSPAF